MTDDRSRRRVPLYLCCAEENEVALIQVIDELHREGLAPEVVSGLETDPSILALAVDRARGEGLFVFCLTEELDRVAVRRLEGLFSARRGPSQRAITVPLHAKHPLAVLPAIRKAMHALVSGEGQEEAPETRASTLCDVVGPVALTAPGSRPARTPRVPVPVARGPIRAPRDAASSSETLPVPTADVEVLLGEPDELTAPQRPVGLGRPMPVISVSPTRSSGPSRWAWLGAIAVVAGLAGVAVLAIGPDHDAALAQAGVSGAPEGAFLAEHRDPRTGSLEPRRGQARRPPSSGAVQAKASRDAAVAAAEAEDAVPPERTPLADAPNSVAPAEPALRDDAAPPDEAEAPTLAEAPPRDAEAVRPQPVVENEASTRDARTGPVVRTNPPTAHERHAARVAAAIDHGVLRRFGGLLVTSPSVETLDWSSAREHCEAAAPGSITGFRLPRTEQLRRLQSLLPAGNYWARDALEQSDEAVAFDQGSGRTHVYLRVEPAARAVCVRVE